MSNEYIQIWCPDTCECVVHQAVDKDKLGQDDCIRFVPPEEAAEIFHEYRKRNPKTTHQLEKQQWAERHPARLCKHHEQHGHTQKRFDLVKEENDRKNKVVRLLSERMKTDPTEFQFKYDEDRVLTVVHPKMQIPDVQEELDAEHGQGKVKLNG